MNIYFVDHLLGSFGGMTDEEQAEARRTIDPNDAAAVKRLITTVLKPAFDRYNAESQCILRENLSYFLTAGVDHWSNGYENQLAAQDIVQYEGGLSADETKDWMYSHDLKYTHPYARPVVEKALPKGDNWTVNALIATSGLPAQNRQQEIVQGGLQIAGTAVMVVGGTYGNAGTANAEVMMNYQGAGAIPVSYADAQGWELPPAGGENRFARAGRLAHEEEPLPPGFIRKVKLPSGKEMDAYNPETREVREIKPNNPRQIKRGEKQVKGYCDECDVVHGPGHTGTVQTYDPAPYVKRIDKEQP